MTVCFHLHSPRSKQFHLFRTGLTVQVVVLLAVWVCERIQFLEQEGILQHPLDGFDQVGFQGGGVLLLGVALFQEGLEIGIGFG